MWERWRDRRRSDEGYTRKEVKRECKGTEPKLLLSQYIYKCLNEFGHPLDYNAFIILFWTWIQIVLAHTSMQIFIYVYPLLSWSTAYTELSKKKICVCVCMCEYRLTLLSTKNNNHITLICNLIIWTIHSGWSFNHDFYIPGLVHHVTFRFLYLTLPDTRGRSTHTTTNTHTKHENLPVLLCNHFCSQ